MSYILEALKKSQQERQQEMLPAGAIFPPAADIAPVQATLPAVLLWAGGGLILLLLVAMWLTFRPSGASNNMADMTDSLVDHADEGVAESVVGRQESLATVVTTDETTHETAAPAEPVTSAIVSGAPAFDPPARPLAVVNPDLVVRARPAPPLPKPDVIPLTSGFGPNFGRAYDNDAVDQQGEADVAASSPLQTSAVGASADAAAESASEERLPAFEQRRLPPLSALAKLPDLIISSHIYSSDPAMRRLNMNGRNWREGDVISRDVTLQEITPEGILVIVDGYPFHINSNNGWQALDD
jgi:general secretion pathway protein B